MELSKSKRGKGARAEIAFLLTNKEFKKCLHLREIKLLNEVFINGEKLKKYEKAKLHFI